MKPVIGINCDYENGKCFLKEEYADAIAIAGGIPVILPIIDLGFGIWDFGFRIDGLLLSGGNDISPERYGESPHEKTRPVSKKKEDFDFLLLKHAFDIDLPVLGICYGLQLINVSLGGTLIQDISSQHETAINHRTNTHNVHIEKTSRLYKILKQETICVNSSHHQAINSLGNKLRVTAKAEDGLIEAVESLDHTFVVGVQWHPERPSPNPSPHMGRGEGVRQIELFKTLIDYSKRVFERRKKVNVL